MKLIVGLGNPGSQYETTRHNIGFLCADYLVDSLKFRGPAVKEKAEVYQGTIQTSEGNEQALIIKPQTFMNLSGRSVGPLYHFYKCKPEDLIVIYDELDINPGEIRFKNGGSSGGHNGIKSIDEAVGSENLNYLRIRLGIGHPRTQNLRMDVSDYVLGKIPDPQWENLEDLFKRAEEGMKLILNGKMNEAMRKFHAKPLQT